MKVRGCVGTVVDLYGSRQSLGDSLQILGSLISDSAMCVALLANTTIKTKKPCQESFEIIQNGDWKDPKVIVY